VSTGGTSNRDVADARRIAKGTGIGLVGGAATYVFLLGYTFVALQALGKSGLGLLAIATVVNMLVSETADLVSALQKELRRVIIGQDEVIAEILSRSAN